MKYDDAPDLTARLLPDGLAHVPTGAPWRVQRIVAAANRIIRTPYVWGGGHGSFQSAGYDCSGSVSYALHGGDYLTTPRDSDGLMLWGRPGRSRWVTVYANAGHAYMTVAGLRFDTSGGAGPRWHSDMRPSRGFFARQPQPRLT